jgi:excisionase family DNA binding protein
VNPESAIQPELLTTAKAAKLCGVSKRHFEVQAGAGRIGPAKVRLGGSVRWHRSELIAWIDAGLPSRAAWLALRDTRRRAS